MLKTIRTNTKTIIWIIISFLVLWCIGEAITYPKHSSKIAKVYGKNVSDQKFQEFYKIVSFSPRYQNLLQSEQILPDDFLADTTLQYIALYQAAKKKIKVTDEDVKEAVLQRFSQQGIFLPEVYMRWVQNVYKSSQRSYEEGVRKELHVLRLIESFSDSIEVTPDETKQAILLEKTLFKVRYLALNAKQFENQVPLQEDQIELYYHENKEKLLEPERYDITFLFFDPASFSSQIIVEESEALDFYKKSIQGLGDSNAVPQFEAIKENILNELKLRKSKKIANEKSKQIEALITEKRNFNIGAKESGTEAQRTGLKTAQELTPYLGFSATLETQLKQMNKSSVVSLDTSKGSYVLILNNKEYAYTPPYANIKEKTKQAYLADRSLQLAQSKANEYYEALKDKSHTFETLASQLSLQIQTSNAFSSTIPYLKDLGKTSQLINQIQSLDNTTFIPPYENGNQIVLIELLEKVEPTEEEIEKDQEAYKERLINIKTNAARNEGVYQVLQEANIQNFLKQKDDPFANIPG